MYTKCWFILADDCLCHHNNHLKNLLGHNNSKNEHVLQWMINVDHGFHDHYVWSKHDPNGMILKQCGNGKKWFGFMVYDNEVGSINTTLSGCGNTTLDFGNCNEDGIVVAYKNGKELGHVFGLNNMIIAFEFFDGDSIEIRGYYLGRILLNNFVQDPCPGKFEIFIRTLQFKPMKIKTYFLIHMSRSIEICVLPNCILCNVDPWMFDWRSLVHLAALQIKIPMEGFYNAAKQNEKYCRWQPFPR